MRPSELRRLVILAEGEFGPHGGKTAYGVIRYGRDDVVAVIDSTKAGQDVDAYLPGHRAPIVATLAEALALPARPDALLIGIAPTGGRLPDSWRAVILEAIAAGLDVLSGLHTFIGDDPEFAAAAAARGTAIVDYRRPPERMETAVGRRHGPGKRVILTVGSDCAIGKMSVALELRRVLRPGGLVIYTARTTADAHYGTGTPRGDDMYEHGGFIVHFFNRALIEHLAAGFELIDVSDFTEGELPRRLARVTMRVPRS